MNQPVRGEVARNLVISATPLTRKALDGFLDRFGTTADFADLSSLRRRGLRTVFRELRSRPTASVVVTGTAEDFDVFGDLLRCLALCVRAPERTADVPPAAPEPIRWRQLPGILSGFGLGAAGGFFALLVNALVASFPVRARALSLPTDWKPKHCLYLRPTLMFGTPVGGSVTHVAGVVNGLQRGGTQVHLVAPGEQPMLDPDVRRVPTKPAFRPVYPPELNSHRYHRLFFRTALACARKIPLDLIYQRYALNDLTGFRLRRRFRVPFILEFNGSEVWVQRHWGKSLHFERASRRIEEANLRSADLVVVVSEEVKRQALRAGVLERRILFYPNCVDPSAFDPVRFGASQRQETRTALGIPGDADLFTFVGTFGQWHGTDVLATAIRNLIEEHLEWLRSRRLHFLLVGDGQFMPQVRSILGKHLASGFVTLAGFQPQGDTPEILAASDVLLAPHVPNRDGTPFFGSPTKLFEYMAMEKLIVASDLDQIGRVLRGWRPLESGVGNDVERPAAILVRPGDVDSLIEGIDRAAKMGPTERRELGTLARSYVLRAFTWDQNVHAVLSALDRALLRPNPAENPYQRAEVKA